MANENTSVALNICSFNQFSFNNPQETRFANWNFTKQYFKTKTLEQPGVLWIVKPINVLFYLTSSAIHALQSAFIRVRTVIEAQIWNYKRPITENPQKQIHIAK